MDEHAGGSRPQILFGLAAESKSPVFGSTDPLSARDFGKFIYYKPTTVDAPM